LPKRAGTYNKGRNSEDGTNRRHVRILFRAAIFSATQH
jgi:hypothetical protein